MSDSEIVSIREFKRLDIRTGTVKEIEQIAGSEKLYKLQVDMGDHQRQLCAGIKGHYAPEQLIGRNIVVVSNLAPRMMRGEQSQGMLLAASSADRTRVILLTTESDIEPGASVS